MDVKPISFTGPVNKLQVAGGALKSIIGKNETTYEKGMSYIIENTKGRFPVILKNYGIETSAKYPDGVTVLKYLNLTTGKLHTTTGVPNSKTAIYDGGEFTARIRDLEKERISDYRTLNLIYETNSKTRAKLIEKAEHAAEKTKKVVIEEHTRAKVIPLHVKKPFSANA